MYLLYTILLLLALPFLMMRLYWRSIRQVAYRKRLRERFVCYQVVESVTVWLHAVSLGEVIAMTPFLKKLLTVLPKKQLLITTTTPTGSAQVQKTFADQVQHVYMPYDLSFLIRRFLNLWQPRLALFIETEIWPNTLNCCEQLSIQTIFLNARLSESSYRGYRYLQRLFPKLFQQMNIVAAQSEPEAIRFRDLGARNVSVVGSMKFDLQIPADLASKALQWRSELSDDIKLWIAASTHPGEEIQILKVFHILRKSHSTLRLILVPRHVERGSEIRQLCIRHGFSCIQRTSVEIFPQETDILLVDTLGELLLFYAMSDIVFVGGSLVPHGGHNLIEPCALAKATLSGPHVKNFNDLKRLLIGSKAAIYVNDLEALTKRMDHLLSDPFECKALGDRAEAVVRSQQGSLDRQLKLVMKHLLSFLRKQE